MTATSFLFENFVLDSERRELRCAGTVVAMGPQVFDLLLFLVSARHRVVSKDDLIEKVWGGRVVSDSTVTSHLNAVRKAVGDTGREQRLIRTVSRKGVRFVGDVREEAGPAVQAGRAAAAEAGASPVLALPDRPSIAVLPFQNMSDDPQQAYFANGMAEDIITALSRFRSLFVIARNSSFSYAGRAVDVRQVGRDLGVRYILEGSVRRAGDKVRFTTQLVDATTGGHVWADRHDGPLENLFDLQDRITEAVVGVIEPAIQQADIENLRRKRPEHMGAYDFFLRSLARTNEFTRDSVEASLAAARQAIALDPSFAPAYALAARAHIQRFVQGWAIDESTRDGALDLVERGLQADRFDALMLATAGHCFARFAHDLPKGIAFIDEAIAINPNLVEAYLHSGFVRIRAGDTHTALDHLAKALRLSPRDLRNYAIFQSLALANFIEGDAETARRWAQRSVQHNPNYSSGWYALAAAAAATGHMPEARQATVRLLGIDPGFTIDRWARGAPIGDAARFEAVFRAMRQAGIPD